jgi:hypothetical protein
MENKILIIFISVAILLVVSVFAYKLVLRRGSNDASVMLFLDHSVNQSLAIKISLDGEVIFDNFIKPETTMPPIAFSKELILSNGEHIIKFEDKTRNIVEEKKFKIPEIKTVFVKTEKDAVEEVHIVLDSEKVYVK